MSGIDADLVAQDKDLLPHRPDQTLVAAARQIGSPDGACEKGIAGEDSARTEQADSPRGVAGRVDHPQAVSSEVYLASFLKKSVRPFLQSGSVEPMDQKGRARDLSQLGVCARVVPVAVGVQDPPHPEVFSGQFGGDAKGISARIDDSRLEGLLATHDVAIRPEWAHHQPRDHRQGSYPLFLFDSVPR